MLTAMMTDFIINTNFWAGGVIFTYGLLNYPTCTFVYAQAAISMHMHVPLYTILAWAWLYMYAIIFICYTDWCLWDIERLWLKMTFGLQIHETLRRTMHRVSSKLGRVRLLAGTRLSSFIIMDHFEWLKPPHGKTVLMIRKVRLCILQW